MGRVRAGLRSAWSAALLALSALVVIPPAGAAIGHPTKLARHWASNTTSGGLTWSQPQSITPNDQALQVVSCPSTTFCIALGGDDSYTYNGMQWSAPVPKGDTDGFASISCASTSFCAAVGASGEAIVYRDGTWSPVVDADSSYYLDAVSCVSTPIFCAAVDQGTTRCPATSSISTDRTGRNRSLYRPPSCTRLATGGWRVLLRLIVSP